jgi:hypothetical protein
MKLKTTHLQKVERSLKAIGAQYLKQKVKARNEETKVEVETVCIMCGLIFNADGTYLFAVPVANPIARNGALTDENAG